MTTNFGGEYPPGVTGNEPEIAGWPDEECSDCMGAGHVCEFCGSPYDEDISIHCGDHVVGEECETCNGEGVIHDDDTG